LISVKLWGISGKKSEKIGRLVFSFGAKVCKLRTPKKDRIRQRPKRVVIDGLFYKELFFLCPSLFR